MIQYNEYQPNDTDYSLMFEPIRHYLLCYNAICVTFIYIMYNIVCYVYFFILRQKQVYK